jgi:L-rhamnose mutarotase
VNRYCFLLQVRTERIVEYRARHRSVWPDMLAALRDTGWTNYSLFLRPDGLLVGYVEAEDLDTSREAMAALAVNARWQAEMADFFVGLDGRRPDAGFHLLEEVFHLEDQIDTHAPQAAPRRDDHQWSTARTPRQA